MTIQPEGYALDMISFLSSYSLGSTFVETQNAWMRILRGVFRLHDLRRALTSDHVGLAARPPSSGTGTVPHQFVSCRHAHFTSITPKWLDRVPPKARPVGWAGVIKKLRLNCPQPYNPVMSPKLEVEPEDIPAVDGWKIWSGATPDDSLEADLKIAAELEVPNLHVLGAALSSPKLEHLEEAILDVLHCDAHSEAMRRLWFFYEWISGKRLEALDDVDPSLPIVDALNENHFYTSLGVTSERHRVRDNLLGYPDFCPMVHRSRTLAEYASKNFASQAWFLLNRFTPELTRDSSTQTAMRESVYSLHGQYDMNKLVQSLVEHGNLDDLPLDEHTLQCRILPVLMGVSEHDAAPRYRSEQVLYTWLCCVVLCRIVLCCVALFCVALLGWVAVRCVTLYCILLCCVWLHHPPVCRAVMCCAVLCCAVLVLCCVMSCQVISCRVVRWWAVTGSPKTLHRCMSPRLSALWMTPKTKCGS